MQEDIYGFWPLQQREASATGRDVSFLRRGQRRAVADGHGGHYNSEEPKRLNCGRGNDD